jgi:hypothetical protein
VSGGKRTCSACTTALAENEGVAAFDMVYCATCFISEAGKFHRPIRAEDIELLKTIGREAAGHLPADLVRMLTVGFYRRATGSAAYPPEDELARFVGEIQRLAMFSNIAKILNLLKTWQGMFNEFVESQEGEIRDTVKRLTE